MFSFLKNKSVDLYPWAGKESIYQYIKRNVDSAGKLPVACEDLPDKDDYFKGKPFQWIAGAMEGIFGHHTDTDKDSKQRINEVNKLLRRQLSNPCNSTRRATYLSLIDEGVIEYIDPFLDHIRKQNDINLQNLYNEAVWFASQSAHRNVVKAGVALLSLFNCEDQKELLLMLGRHDEFTLYAVVAIKNGFTKPNICLFELADLVDGWGKISIVERLEADTQEIRDWLLRKGCQNRIMPEYLAYICATKGNLKDALSVNEIDEDLYKGAGIIISALISGGPAEDIDDYDDSMSVIINYLRHSTRHCTDIEDLLVIISISNYLHQEDEQWDKRYSAGWEKQIKEKCQLECKMLTSKSCWPQIMWAELKSGDNYKRYCAIQAAKSLEIDNWDELFEQLGSNPLDNSLYYNLMQTKDRERVIKLVTFAEKILPLKDVSIGPSNEMGLGPEFKVHGCLDFMLQDLENFEGIGLGLIKAALFSPVVRNRNMAIKALGGWKKSSWSDDMVDMLEKLHEIEPDCDVKKRVEELLNRRV